MNPDNSAFASHPRRWRDFRYVYPVVSRRSKGLSIGVNLNVDAACNFNCVYCQVDRSRPRDPDRVDLPTLEQELRHLVAHHDELFGEPEFRDVAPAYHRLNDIAFSGDGEPTASPLFGDAVRLATEVRRDYGLDQAKIIVITNACFLTRPRVAAALVLLDEHNGEIWAKLDAGTEKHLHAVNRCNFSLQHVLDGILSAARVRPVVIQSLFMRMHDHAPPYDEMTAYVDRLRWLVGAGAQLKLVQLYTVARQPKEPFVGPLTPEELDHLAVAVRPIGIPVECYA